MGRRRPVRQLGNRRYTRIAATATERVATAIVEDFGRRLDETELRTRPLDEILALIQGKNDCGKSATIATLLRHMADRAAFAREVLGFEPEPLQEVALRSWSRRLILNCNRQWGKSTVAAIRAVHRAWFWPGSLILIVSRAHPQAGELLTKIRAFLPALGIGAAKGDGVNRLSVKFPNGSRIVALPGGEKPTRSYSRVALVIVDEAAMVADPVHDAVAPTLAVTNGDLMLVSTPRGKRGAFYRAWEFGGEAWARVFGPVTDCSSGRISGEFLEMERARGGADFFAQEYLCEFLDRDAHLFGEDELREVFAQDLECWER